jgi:hypothetical protein
MFSLAPLLYRNVFADEGGPIARTQSSAVQIFDQPSYQVGAFLRPELMQGERVPVMYSTADGTGSAENPAVAKHIAISEALERWAYHETHDSPERGKYGFLVDRSSNGMSAFPGFKWQARRRARFEALERYALIGWWDRQLDAKVQCAPYPDVGLIRIQHGQDFGEVVILFHRAPTGFVAYGHAAGSTLATATSRAVVELMRCEMVISRYRSMGGLADISNYFEKRCLYFSTPEGFAEFHERTRADANKPATRWKTAFDGEIPGPWSQWATVWRHCVEMPCGDFLDRNKNFFFW